VSTIVGVNVLVTGGTGYLGRAIVGALVARGHAPVVFARAATAAALPGRAIDGDVRDAAGLRRAAQGCDAICHTAALVTVWRPRARDFDDVNVGGLVNVLAAARDAGVHRLVYTSSFLARAPAGARAPLRSNDYQRTKAEAADVARRAQDAGAPVVILAPGVVYGPGIGSEGNLVGRMLADHLAGRLPGLIGADRIWSFAWIDDVARAHVAALEHTSPAAEYELGGENAPQIRPFEIARDLQGTPLPRRLPYWLASTVAVVEEARTRVTGRPPRITRATVEIFRHDWLVASKDAERDLDYAPTPLATGIRRLIEEPARTKLRKPS
jgi:nucleoside-diphosphate-sugar epimerase